MSNLVAYALVSLSEIKEALDISTTEHDAKLNGYINRATDIIETYCKRRFLTQVYTEEIYNGGGQYLQLRNFPVTSLGSIKFRGGAFNSPAWSDLDSSMYTLDTDGGKNTGLLFLDGGFSYGQGNFQATYTAGYATTADIPGDVKEACIELVAYLFGRRKATPGLKSETLGRYSYTIDSPNTTSTGRGILKMLGLDELLSAYRTPTV